jgi:hypothetical protein
MAFYSEAITSGKIEQTGTTSGLIFPRMTDAQMRAMPPDEAEAVYNTTFDAIYVYANGSWAELGSNAPASVIDGGSA